MNVFKRFICLFIGHDYVYNYYIKSIYKRVGKKTKNDKYRTVLYNLYQYKECRCCGHKKDEYLVNRHLSKRDLLCRYDINIY